MAVIPFMHIHNSDKNMTQYNQLDEYEMDDYNEDGSISDDISNNSNNNPHKMNEPRKRNFIYRLFIDPFLNFASNPYLFYPYHFFHIYNLIGPQLFGNLLASGDTFKERFVVAFLHGVIANGKIVNIVDGYFYMLKDLLKSQWILFFLMVYLNHCKCRQFFITILVHAYLIYFCIATRKRIFISYNAFQLFVSPFYTWFMIWEIITIIVLIINNFKKYPSNCDKLFSRKQQ